MDGVDINNAAMEELLFGVRKQTLEETAEDLKNRCVQNAPERTGELKREHKVGEVNLDATEVEVVADTDYAASVHEGARAHEIPNAFGRGEPVEHPGNDPNPWMSRSIDQMAAGLDAS